jgi:hypothetical protein
VTHIVFRLKAVLSHTSLPFVSTNGIGSVRRACALSVVKVHWGVVTDEPESDSQVSVGDGWERGSDSEIVA